MSQHTRVRDLRAERKSAGGDISGRHVRTPWSLQIFAIVVTFAFLLVTVVPPTSLVSSAAIVTNPPVVRKDPQSLLVRGDHVISVSRDAFGVTEKPKPVVVVRTAPAAGVPDPGSAQAIAWEMLQARGWGADQFDCLVALWNRESGWNVYAHNASSGAYGIPQALPGEKMATVGADWATNAATQITWGLGYIGGRYGTPCGAWAYSEAHGWY